MEDQNRMFDAAFCVHLQLREPDGFSSNPSTTQLSYHYCMSEGGGGGGGEKAPGVLHCSGPLLHQGCIYTCVSVCKALGGPVQSKQSIILQCRTTNLAQSCQCVFPFIRIGGVLPV